MAEDTHDDSGTPTQEAKVFTQAELDEKIQARVEREKAGRQKAIDDAVAKALKEQAEKSRIESLQGEERIKAEYQAELARIDAERKASAEQLASAQRELAVSKAQGQLAGMGYPTDFAENLLGKDDAETSRNIQAFDKAVKALVTEKVNEAVARGTPAIGNSATATPSWQNEIAKAMKL